MAHHSSEQSPDLEKIFGSFPQLAPPGFPFGATGNYPQGKLTPEDEGEIQFGIAADSKTGKVVINFGKPVVWVGMQPEQAIALANSLREQAGKILGNKD